MNHFLNGRPFKVIALCIFAWGWMFYCPPQAWPYYPQKNCALNLLPPLPWTMISSSSLSLPQAAKVAINLPYIDTNLLEAKILHDEGIILGRGLRAAYQVEIPPTELRMILGHKDSSHVPYARELGGNHYTLLLFAGAAARDDFVLRPLPDQNIDIIIGVGDLKIDDITYYTVLVNHAQYQVWYETIHDQGRDLPPEAIKQVIQDYYLDHYLSLKAAQRQEYLNEEVQHQKAILAWLDEEPTSDDQAAMRDAAIADGLNWLIERRMKELQAAHYSHSFLAYHGLRDSPLANTYWQARQEKLTSYHRQDWNYRYYSLAFMLDPQILTIFYPVSAKAKVNAKQVLELLLGPSLAAAPALRSYLRMCVIASNGLPLHRGRY
ncbi:MAG: hypothetical protein J6Y94_03255, partial [Bacteriovoracaceae bacterium]|nr:hypothetical protein [Bacteriovoracaceae bacterium]